MTFGRADILLPKFSNDSERMKKWSVVACDQYTSEPDYWKEIEGFVGDSESVLKMIVPEIYLNSADIDKRITDTNTYMDEYIKSGIFEECKNTYIYVERKLKNGVTRRGIVGAVDLEDYDFSTGSQTKIRATEGTVISRIPPRLKVRCDAAVEFPHIMMLIDNEERDIIEPNANLTCEFEKLYDFDLAEESGHIVGYKMSENAAETFEKKLLALDDINKFNQKYQVNETSPLIYAMGDGNHSLATAKVHYENLKKDIGEEAARRSPARYALCELVNLHDDSLEFEAIHRVVFNADGEAFLSEFERAYNVSFDTNAKGQKFTLVTKNSVRQLTVTNPTEYLTVATVQNFLDKYVTAAGGEIDYIHGEDVVHKLCEDENNFGIIFKAMNKSDLFKSVIMDGALPRKTFSMGEACDKRFYVEGRKIK